LEGSTVVFVKKKRKKAAPKKKRALEVSVHIDYKDTETLKKFVTERGKIIPRRVSGASAMQQREITRQIKRARYMALLPYSIAHRQEKKIFIEAALTADAYSQRPSAPAPQEQGGGDDE
jgi:small subunit ribosomal protein S18